MAGKKMFGLKCRLSQAEIERKTEDILSKMTVDEKAMLLSGNANMIKDMILYKRTYNPVPIYSHGCKRLKVKPIGFSDGPRGVVMGNSTCFPVSMARAASFDRDLEARIGDAIGKEARAGKANYFGGVCVNLLMHPAGGRAQESYGEDPYLVGEMGASLVRGVQKNNVMACVKHYAVNNMENRRFHVNVKCSDRTLHEVYLPHFKKCVDAGAASLMGSYNKFRDDQASESHELLTEILRDQWGFEGFTITDFFFALRDTKKAIEAGMDMEMPMPTQYGVQLADRVKSGQISQKVLDESARRVIRTSLIFENTPDPVTYTKDMITCKEHVALAKEAAEKSMVLIKNENAVLPFRRSAKKVLVVGHLAEQENTGDHGSSRVYAKGVVTALAGIKDYLGSSTEVVYFPETAIEEAKKEAPTADAVIFVVGNDYADEGEFVVPDSSMNATEFMARGMINNKKKLLGKMMLSAAAKQGENVSYTSSDGDVATGGDRKSLSLKEIEIKAIKEIAPLNPNTVVTIVSGSMVMTKEWDDQVPAILYSWYSGMEGGKVLPAILFGTVNPSGKLPFSIPADENHLPQVDFMQDEIYYEFDHGYRKLDHDGNKPAYPFGYGLSYTSYAYGKAAAEYQGDAVCIMVPVENTGKLAGDEIVQVYVSVPESTVERHVKELKGFARISLQPGEKKDVTIRIPLEELKYYDEKAKAWVLEKTGYEFLVGPNANPDVLATIKVSL